MDMNADIGPTNSRFPCFTEHWDCRAATLCVIPSKPRTRVIATQVQSPLHPRSINCTPTNQQHLLLNWESILRDSRPPLHLENGNFDIINNVYLIVEGVLAFMSLCPIHDLVEVPARMGSVHHD